MVRINLLLPVFLTALVTASVLELFDNDRCDSVRDKVSADLNFRDAQCDVTGKRFDCYAKNMELLNKELRREGCAR